MGANAMRRLALLTMAALLFAPLTGYAFAAEFACTPAEGEMVAVGDSIAYTLTIGEEGASEEWTALRIRLDDGLQVQTDSIVVAFAKDVPEGQSPPAYEIVPGNDGFVVLFSSLRQGDSVTFDGRVDAAQANISVQAQTEGFSVSAAHVRKPEPQQTARPVGGEQAVVEETPPAGRWIRWLLAALCVAVLVCIGILAWRRWGAALNRWGMALCGKLKLLKGFQWASVWKRRGARAAATQAPVEAETGEEPADTP